MDVTDYKDDLAAIMAFPNAIQSIVKEALQQAVIKLDIAFENGDMEAVRQVAHKIAGSLAMTGSTKYSKLAKRVEAETVKEKGELLYKELRLLSNHYIEQLP